MGVLRRLDPPPWAIATTTLIAIVALLFLAVRGEVHNRGNAEYYLAGLFGLVALVVAVVAILKGRRVAGTLVIVGLLIPLAIVAAVLPQECSGEFGCFGWVIGAFVALPLVTLPTFVGGVVAAVRPAAGDSRWARSVHSVATLAGQPDNAMLSLTDEARSVRRRDRRFLALLGVLVVTVMGFLVARVSALLLPWSEPSLYPTLRMSSLEESEFGVVYFKDHEVFVVLTKEGPIALSAEAQHVANDKVRYCPLSGYFEGLEHGERFDRLGRFAAGPATRDMDRFFMIVYDDGGLLVQTTRLLASLDRSTDVDPPQGPHCDGLQADSDSGFFVP